MSRVCKGFLVQTCNKTTNLKAYDFQNKSHIRYYNCFRKFFSVIQTTSLSELGIKEEELRKKMLLASSSPYSTFYPLSCLFCDWLVSNHLACYKSHLSLSRFSIRIFSLGFTREENNTVRLYQKHYHFRRDAFVAVECTH